MDDCKKPLVLDAFVPADHPAPEFDLTISSSASTSASTSSHHLRLSSPVLTGRFSLRRPPSAASRRSRPDFKSILSCVTRQTPHDECTRYRFIAWVAAKRNESPNINDYTKRECPLFHCRKVFISHEVMVKHLFDCDHLADGEYWCVDHMKCERFDDGKCKGCCGHPTRRRKIMTMAKTFFSNLGHKTKHRKGLGSVGDEPPPSYYSLHHELSGSFDTQLHEADSREIPLPPLPEISVPFVPDMAPTITPAELQATTDASNDPFHQQPHGLPNLGDLPVPLILGDDSPSLPSPSRPALPQLNTLVGKQRPVRPPPQPRSKNLSPSSSVRSTTSTTSTTSTVSTVSTVSTTSQGSLVSPISVLSATSMPFAMVSGANTGQLSPEDGLSPDFMSDAIMTGCDDSALCGDGRFAVDMTSWPIIAELAGEQPVVQGQAADECHISINLDTLPFGKAAPNGLAPIPDVEVSAPSFSEPVTDDPEMDVSELFACSNPKTLIDSAWVSLEEHIRNSLAKVADIEDNPLVEHLKELPVRTVADKGLSTLKGVLQGLTSVSSVDCLCFVHLMYAFSVAVYEEHAQSRSKELFAKSLACIKDLPLEDQFFYKQAVCEIWQPLDVSALQVEQFLIREQSKSLSRSSSHKGKQRELPALQQQGEEAVGAPLLSVAQDFLDELESVVLFGQAERSLDDAELSLRRAHRQAAQTDRSNHAAFPLFISWLLDELKNSLPQAEAFHEKLDEIRGKVDSGDIASARRAELEVLRAGKCSFDFGDFHRLTPHFRAKFDALLYQHTGHPLFPRSAFYIHDVALVASMMSDLEPVTDPAAPSSYTELLDDIIAQNFDPSLQAYAAPPAQHSHCITDASPSVLVSPTPIPLPSPLSSPATPHLTASSLSNVPVASSAEPHHPPEQDISLPPPTQSTDQTPPQSNGTKTESHEVCELCGYRPKGDPRWFQGSMAKHKKTKHSAGPDKIFKCPYPGCNSAYKNREDNLKQHQKEKGHYVVVDDDNSQSQSRRPSKRKKVSE